MKRIKYRPFTLFLCLALIVFILFAPHFLMKPQIDELFDKVFKKNIEWKGIITVRDYPRLDVETGYKYSWIMGKIKAFERNNPGVIIDFKPLNSEFGHIELETAIKANACPDIAPVGANYEIICRGVLEPLDRHIDNDEIDKYKTNVISAVTYDNKIWGLPYMMEDHCLFLNMDLFNEAGVKPPKDGNWTYDEFVEVLKKLTCDKNGDGDADVFGFNSYIKPNSYSTFGILLSDGGKIINTKNGKYEFHDEKAISGLKKLTDLKLVHGVTPKNFGSNSSVEAWKSFAIDKKVAVYPGKTSLINVLRVLNNRGKGFNFGVANYPTGKVGKPISSGNTITAYGIFKQEDEKKLKMCIKFIEYLANDEGQKEIYKQGAFPVKKDLNNMYKNDKLMSHIEKNLEKSEVIGVHSNWGLIDDALQSQIRMAILGKKTSEEAIKSAKEKIDQTLANSQ
ncbi:MAG: extracellular solute-binding protein [Maledivibacter sp.]|nr:extracellular solute-binding protein [Maledivibacter sp.]